MPQHTFDVNVKGLMTIGEWAKIQSVDERPVIFHASTSEMFGQVE